MKRVVFLSCMAALLWMSISEARAQQHVELTKVGLSILPPSQWSDTTMWKLSEEDPAMAFYHIQVDATGQSVAVRREECRTDEHKRSWTSGNIARQHLSDDDMFTALSEDAPVSFGTHSGFELASPRGDVIMRAYSFLWTDDEWCYRADFGAPDESFAGSSSDFQHIIDSIQILH